MSNELNLKPGTRLRTGGTTWEVTDEATVPAGVVPVIPQPARLLKVFCAACGYTVRVTKRWIDKSGTPICPCGHGAMVEAVKAEKTEPAPRKSKAPKAAKPAPLPEPDHPVLKDVRSALEDLMTEAEPEVEPLDEPAEVAPAPSPAAGDSPLARLLANL